MTFFDELQEQKNYSLTDKQIANYILENAQSVINENITELAKNTFVSTSSIVKFYKKNGFNGYHDMKISISLELSRYINQQKNRTLELPITPATKNDELPNIVFGLYNQSLINTLNSIDMKQIQYVTSLIFEADFVSLYGAGESKTAAEDLLFKLKSINVPVDSSIISASSTSIFRNKLTKKPLAIIFSQYANTPRFNAWIDQLETLNYKIVLITSNKNIINPNLVKIYINIHENRDLRVSNYSSKIAMSYIIDVLYLTLFKIDYHKNYHYILKNKEQQKKIIEKYKTI